MPEKYNNVKEYNYENYKCIADNYLFYTFTATSTLALLLGIISWIKITKFRRFKNYVFLNIIFANVFYKVYVTLWTKEQQNYVISHNGTVVYYLILLGQISLEISFHYWLLICSALFYVQIVKVFGPNISRRYIKCALFGWVTPLVLGVGYVGIDFINFGDSLDYAYVLIAIQSALIYHPLIINVFIYMIVLCKLLIIRNVQTRSRVLMATMTLVMSGLVMILNFNVTMLNIFFKVDLFIMSVFFTLRWTQSFLICFVFLMLKSNRVLWCQALSTSQVMPSTVPMRSVLNGLIASQHGVTECQSSVTKAEPV